MGVHSISPVRSISRWVDSDEALVNSGKPLPSGRVGQVVELLSTIDAEASDTTG